MMERLYSNYTRVLEILRDCNRHRRYPTLEYVCDGTNLTEAEVSVVFDGMVALGMLHVKRHGALGPPTFKLAYQLFRNDRHERSSRQRSSRMLSPLRTREWNTEN